MSDFLTEAFERFDPAQQARIRAAEASAKGVLSQGNAEVSNHLRVGRFASNRDWLLQPQDEARADAAGVVFIAYINALWESTDRARTEHIHAFLADVDKLIHPVLAKYGHWEGKDTLSQLRAECEKGAWLVHSNALGADKSARDGGQPSGSRFAHPEICFVTWGPIPEDHPVGLRVGQGGFYLENDGISAHEISIEAFSVGRSTKASGELVPRIAEKGKGFLLVWLDVSERTALLPVVSKWDLPAAFRKASEEDPAVAARGQGCAVSVTAKYRDSANTWYRSSADLSYIPAQGRLVFGPTAHERLGSRQCDERASQPQGETKARVKNTPQDDSGAVDPAGESASEGNVEMFDPFAEDAGASPLGQNPFPPEHPGWDVFKRAEWGAKEAAQRCKLNYLRCGPKTPDEFLESVFRLKVSYFNAVARCGARVVGNEELGRSYERWITDFARFVVRDTVAMTGVRDPDWDARGFAFFTTAQVENLKRRLTLELLRMVAHYKAQVAARVVFILEMGVAAVTPSQRERLEKLDAQIREAFEVRELELEQAASSSAVPRDSSAVGDICQLRKAILKCAAETLGILAEALGQSMSQQQFRTSLEEDAELISRWLLSQVNENDLIGLGPLGVQAEIKAQANDLISKAESDHPTDLKERARIHDAEVPAVASDQGGVRLTDGKLRAGIEDRTAPIGTLAAAPKTPPLRVPDLKLSRERVCLAKTLASELATIKSDVAGFSTPDQLKRKYPDFTLWKHLQPGELKELTDGIAFSPKAYAENLTLRAFGLTSRETLKKDRQKIRQAAESK